MCIDTDDLTYVIAKTNEDDIDKMIRGNLPIYDLFDASEYLWKAEVGDNVSNDKITRIKFYDLFDSDLPDKNVCYH